MLVLKGIFGESLKITSENKKIIFEAKNGPKRFSESLKGVRKKVPENTRKKQKNTPKSPRFWVFFDFSGIFWDFFVDLWERDSFWDVFCDFGLGGPGDSCKWSLGSQSLRDKRASYEDPPLVSSSTPRLCLEHTFAPTAACQHACRPQIHWKQMIEIYVSRFLGFLGIRTFQAVSAILREHFQAKIPCIFRQKSSIFSHFQDFQGHENLHDLPWFHTLLHLKNQEASAPRARQLHESSLAHLIFRRTLNPLGPTEPPKSCRPPGTDWKRAKTRKYWKKIGRKWGKMAQIWPEKMGKNGPKNGKRNFSFFFHHFWAFFPLFGPWAIFYFWPIFSQILKQLKSPKVTQKWLWGVPK